MAIAAPPRLTELECPHCRATKWIIRSDVNPGYAARSYSCGGCDRNGAGWSIRQQAPRAFLRQPSRMDPMAREDFDRWVAILRESFPDHPRLAELGTRFFPFTPEEAAAEQAAWEREHPVDKLRDQDGAGTDDPTCSTRRIG
jgi:hypothetical protein